jgi:hypothetical protein
MPVYAASPCYWEELRLFPRGCQKKKKRCLLKEIAEGTYRTKHAEAARLDYTTTHRHIDTKSSHLLLEFLFEKISSFFHVPSHQQAKSHQIITSCSVRDRICHAICSPPAIGVAVRVCAGFGACVLRSSYPARNAAKRLSGDLYEWFEAAIHMPLYLLYS